MKYRLQISDKTGKQIILGALKYDKVKWYGNAEVFFTFVTSQLWRCLQGLKVKYIPAGWSASSYFSGITQWTSTLKETVQAVKAKTRCKVLHHQLWHWWKVTVGYKEGSEYICFHDVHKHRFSSSRKCVQLKQCVTVRTEILHNPYFNKNQNQWKHWKWNFSVILLLSDSKLTNHRSEISILENVFLKCGLYFLFYVIFYIICKISVIMKL